MTISSVASGGIGAGPRVQVEASRDPVALRWAAPDDGPRIQAMHDRCTSETRYKRWHGQTTDLPSEYLRGALAASTDHLAVVAEVDSQIVGIASAVLEPSGARQVAILVEDAWQRHGLGTRMLDRLVGASVALGACELEADVLVDYPQPFSLLARYGPVRRRVSFGIVAVRVPLTRR